MHPEPNGNHHGSLPEPAIGPETGIAARLSDSLRLTNGFKDRAIDLLPRVSLCFLAEDRASAQRLAVAYPHLYFLLPDGVCYHGHTVTGGKKSGAGPLAMKREARELAVKLQAKQAAFEQMTARLEELNGEITACEAELERLRALQQAREKDRVALDHDMRKLGEDLARANSRLSVARLELERLRRDAEKSAEQRERNRAAVAEKERLRAEREAALEAERQELEKLEGQAAAIGEEHAATRAELAGLEERHRGETSAHGAAGAAVPRDRRRAATRSRRRSSGWARSGRACWPITSSWTRKPRRWRKRSRALEARGQRDGGAGCGHARGAARRRRGTEAAARGRAGRRRRSARRSKWSWCASRPS